MGLALFQFSKNETPEPGNLETASSHPESGQGENTPDAGREALNINEDTAQYYREMGLSAFKEQRYQDALDSFEEGLRYVGDDLGLQLSLAATYLTISDYDMAEEAYERVLAMDPDNLQALKELGQLYYLKNDPENAEIVWNHAALLDPNDALLAKRLSTLRKQISAVEDFDMDENSHFTVTYDGESMPQLEYSVLEIMEKAYYDVGGRLYLYPKRQISVTLMTQEVFFDITGTPTWTSGLYEGQIKLPVAGADPDDLREVLTHEFVHAVIFDQIGQKCPWWLNEGLAQYLSKTEGNQGNIGGGNPEDASSQQMLRLSEYGNAMKMDQKDAARAYASALSAVRYFVESYGETNLQKIIEFMADGESFEEAFWISTGYSFEEFESNWIRHGISGASYE